MCWKCVDGFLAAIILIFTIWEMTYSFWVILIAATIILIQSVFYLISNQGCSIYPCCSFGRETGAELFMEKSKPLEPKPSKQEVEETLKGRR